MPTTTRSRSKDWSFLHRCGCMNQQRQVLSRHWVPIAPGPWRMRARPYKPGHPLGRGMNSCLRPFSQRGPLPRWRRDPEGAKQDPPVIRTPNGIYADDRDFWTAGKALWDPSQIEAPTLVVVGDWDGVTRSTDVLGGVNAGASGCPPADRLRQILSAGRSGDTSGQLCRQREHHAQPWPAGADSARWRRHVAR